MVCLGGREMVLLAVQACLFLHEHVDGNHDGGFFLLLFVLRCSSDRILYTINSKKTPRAFEVLEAD